MEIRGQVYSTERNMAGKENTGWPSFSIFASLSLVLILTFAFQRRQIKRVLGYKSQSPESQTGDEFRWLVFRSD